MTILKSIGTGVMGLGMLLGSFFGYHSSVPIPHAAPQTLGAFNPVGGLTYRIQSSVGLADNTIRLSSFQNRSGLPLTMTLLNTSIGYGTLDPQNPTRSEFISFTGVTQNSDGTAILTGVTRGLSDIYPFTASTTQVLSHSGQSIFILSDSPQLFGQYAVKQNNETISGLYNFSGGFYDNASSTFTSNVTLTGSTTIQNGAYSTFNGTTTFNAGAIISNAPKNNNDVANKKYVDDTASAGAANANTITKGIVQQATITQLNAGTATGSTGAVLFIDPATLAVSTYASTTVMKTTIPFPIYPYTATFGGQGLAINTVLRLGMATISNSITVNKITIEINSVSVAGKLNIGVYSEDGSTLLISTTTSTISGAGPVTTTLTSPVTLLKGNYYIAIQSVGTANITPIFFVQNQSNFNTNQDIYQLSGKPSLTGTTTASAGTLPASFTPTALVNLPTENTEPIIRFDN